MKRTKVALNNNAGAFVAIQANIHARYVKIYEDDAAARTGIQAQFPDDNFTATEIIAGADEPLEFGNKVGIGNNQGPILGTPGYSTGGNTVARTTYCKLRGNGAGATNVWVEEHE